MARKKAAAEAATLIRSRIVGHGEAAPRELVANPKNFRRHPAAQMDALRGSIKELGWVKTVVVNNTTGHVIDGHARIEEAIRAGLATIPVTQVELSEEEERLALAVLDPITAMARHDEEALQALLEDVATDDAGINALLDKLRKEKPVDEDTEGAEITDHFEIIVICETEAEQTELLERLTAEGRTCRALIS